ncbi:DUF536 domain-containing protein [Lactococcus garvieae]|uniref:DUF536 domain-containing protein n=1 Tax=Lactococcus garvieae TaxID=1363 RepID=UPI0022DEA060|nr:DUF536 domain-containing protein [Lactococcus garvieae]
MVDMETKTVSELAELFGVTRQAMNKRIKQLDEQYVEKNEKNVTVINEGGIHELERLYGKVVTAQAEVVDDKDNTQELSISPTDTAVFELVSNLMKDKNAEIDRLNQQLMAKDAQIAEKDKQINRQQELMEKSLSDNNQFLLEMKAESEKGFFAKLFGK